jgi:hypothetical protein
LFVAVGAVWLGAVGLIGQSTTGADPVATVRTEVDRLRSEIEVLDRQVELATGKAFYLILSEEASELRLMYGGALLQQFPVSSMEVGHPRRAFRRASTLESWSSTVWRSGTLVPGRAVEPAVLQPPAPGADEEIEAPVPPTAEEAIPVPGRYLIRFTDGLALEIAQPVDPSEGYIAFRLRRLALRWSEVRSVISQSTVDAVRVRLVLDRIVAEALYRSVPADVGFMAVLGRTSS